MSIVKLPFGDVKAAQTVVDTMLEHGAESHPVLTELRRDVFYGGVVWVGYATSCAYPVSVHCTKLGKRKKNVWEPYANWYGAYTLPGYRRVGHATALYRAMETEAVAAGCRRVKSLAGSSAGLALHKSLGHQCWGRTPNNEVWVDSPLPGSETLYGADERPPQSPGPIMLTRGINILIKQGLRYDKKA